MRRGTETGPGPPHGPPMTPWTEDDDGTAGDQSNTSSSETRARISMAVALMASYYITAYLDPELVEPGW